VNTRRPLVRVAALATAVAFCSCSSHRSAGSMQVRAGHPVRLLLESPEPIEVEVEIWSKGPADVTWHGLSAAATAMGVLEPNGREATWDATTRRLEFELSVAEDQARVHYTVRSDRGFKISMGEQTP